MSQIDELAVPAPAGPSWASTTPWWLISMGIHGVLLLGATVWVIEKSNPTEETGVMVVIQPRSPAVINDIQPVRDSVTHTGPPLDEPAATSNEGPSPFFPEAEPGDHPESADDEDFHQMKGDSKEFMSYIPGEAGGFRGRLPGKTPGVYDTLGVGNGGGSSGRHGGPYGGRKNLVPGMRRGSVATESAVEAALKWLARHQNEDGGWSTNAFSGKCCGAKCTGTGNANYDAGVTGLSLLAFLGAGYTHLSKDHFADPACPGKTLRFGEVVKKALEWLRARQDPAGCVGERAAHYMYNHTICALALSEAYGMTGAPILRESAQRAIDFLVAAQNPGKGWRYTEKCGENDTSVTGWAVMALKSAELSELDVPKSAFDGALAWLGGVTSPNGYYKVGYHQVDSGKVYIKGKNEDFDDHPSMSAVAVMSRIFIQKKRVPELGAVDHLINDLPEWKPKKIDYYYWYYGSLALFQYDGPEGPMWKRWNGPMVNALVPHQKTGKDGCANGSWEVEGDRWAFEGSRVYATAINALTLEVYYRYANVFVGARR